MRLQQQKVPYPMPPALSEEKREEFMAWAIKQGAPRLRAFPIGDETLTIVGYGPSLEDSWQKIKPPVLTTSGALNFLLGKGMVPKFGDWFHCDVDPRPHKLDFIRPPHRDVVYLMGSVCNPKSWKLLREAKVRHYLWHAVSGDHTLQWVHENDPGTVLVGAGSTIGLSAIHLGGVIGFRKFELHGYDGSFKDGRRHAGPHGGVVHGEMPSTLNPAYMTSRLMDNSNVEMTNHLKNFPIFCVFHGDGLMQDWVRKANLHNAAVDGTPQAEVVRRLLYRPIDHGTANELAARGVPVLA